MALGLLYNFTALVALVPASLVHLRPRRERDTVYWSVLGVAVAGSLSWTFLLLRDAWHTGLAVALWVTIAATLVIFIVVAAVSAQAWRLTPLLLPYLLILGVIATIWSQAPEQPLPADLPSGWFEVHISFSVLAYALFTIAAVAGLGVFLQEWALKRKRPGALTRLLPSFADAEDLQTRLLVASEVILGAGIVTGIATQYAEDGSLVSFEHKTLFALLAFVVIGLLLGADRLGGVGGRRAARVALLGYLLLTLAYPGVKFVTDVLLS